MNATVCAIMRGEGPYILNWVAWQPLLGFDQILVYDNDSADGTTATFAALARTQLLTHVPWPDRPGVKGLN